MSEQLYALKPSEQIITKVKRHPIGVAPLLVAAVFAVVGMVLVSAGFSYFSGSLGLRIPAELAMLVAILVMILVMVVAYIAIWVYLHNEFIVTTESVIQVNQMSLFGRAVSQLALEVIQDVTVEQKGIFAHIFNFGTVILETPGEKANFDFKLAPRPHQIAQTIVEAQQKHGLLQVGAAPQSNFSQ